MERYQHGKDEYRCLHLYLQHLSLHYPRQQTFLYLNIKQGPLLRKICMTP